MSKTKYLIIIAGPTAVGKTALSIDLAKRYDAEIISSDSRQYYRELSIGTAKPSEEEQQGIRHHFIDSLSIHDDYSIGQFERDVIQSLDEYYKDRDIMIMTGGSGMHIKAITHGLDEFPDVPKSIRDQYEATYQEEGIAKLRDLLQEKDPSYAAKVDLNNPMRLIRALSIIKVSGRPYSSFLNQPAKKRSFTPIYILLERDRDELYERINRRVNQMLDDGLEAEATNLYQHKDLQALNTIGYKEWFEHFDGETTREEAIALIKRNSRRYAKRQMTWFRGEDQWERFGAEQKDLIINCLIQNIQ